jgi:hypothetical protein
MYVFSLVEIASREERGVVYKEDLCFLRGETGLFCGETGGLGGAACMAIFMGMP